MAVKAGSQAVSRSCTSNAIQLDITLKKRNNETIKVNTAYKISPYWLIKRSTSIGKHTQILYVWPWPPPMNVTLERGKWNLALPVITMERTCVWNIFRIGARVHDTTKFAIGIENIIYYQYLNYICLRGNTIHLSMIFCTIFQAS